MYENEFLKNFESRMRSVGRYAVLCSNSFDKKMWKEYGIESRDEQMNMLFTLLLYIMEYSLREEECTIDDMAVFLAEVNETYYNRTFYFEKSREMARFMVEEVLGNAGNSMYFKAFDYEKRQYKEINIRYVDNKVVYQTGGVKRIAYYLTDEGYNMLLATLELENNLKFTIHEMLFKLHLEKADYQKAADDIKNIFGQLRKQSQKMEEAVHSIKRNALDYSVEDYRNMIEENINTIVDTREKFKVHKTVIEEKLKEFEEREINEKEFTDKENLNYLRVIGGYLARTLEEHQKIFAQHFDLKKSYEYELENYANMNLVQRFSFRSELYDVILKDAKLLTHVDRIWNPLLIGQKNKIFNPEKMLEYQKRLKKSGSEDEMAELAFDAEEYQREKEIARKEHLKKYDQSIRLLLDKLLVYGEITLRELSGECEDEERKLLIPTVEIFRELMIAFLTEGTIDVGCLRKEQTEYLLDASEGFVLNEQLLILLEEKKYKRIQKIDVYPIEDEGYVYFKNLTDDSGNNRNFKCSNIGFRVTVQNMEKG